jgi:hypothetical protein
MAKKRTAGTSPARKRNPTDTTLRNVRAARKRTDTLGEKIQKKLATLELGLAAVAAAPTVLTKALGFKPTAVLGWDRKKRKK